MSKFLLFSKIVLVRSLFLQIFCENIFKIFKIIVLPHPQISKSSWLWFPRAFVTFCYANPDWICISRKDIYYYPSDVCSCSQYTWTNEYIISLSLSWQPLIKMVNNILSKLISEISCKNHKRTWQGVPSAFLYCL